MKNTQYTLRDEEFARFVAKTGEQLSAHGIEHAFVGNVAVQAHILNYLARAHNSTDVRTLGAADELMRNTDRVDVAVVVPDGVHPLSFAGTIAGNVQKGIAHCTLDFEGNEIFDYVLDRSGAKRATYDLVYPTARARLTLKLLYGSEDMGGFGAKFYNNSVKDGRNVHIPFANGSDLTIRVMAPDHLMAAKVERFEPQDRMDIVSLSAASKLSKRPWTLGGVARILGEQYKDRMEAASALL